MNKQERIEHIADLIESGADFETVLEDETVKSFNVSDRTVKSYFEKAEELEMIEEEFEQAEEQHGPVIEEKEMKEPTITPLEECKVLSSKLVKATQRLVEQAKKDRLGLTSVKAIEKRAKDIKKIIERC